MSAPLLSFDRHRYQLGNGCGYFDRTLAVRVDCPIVIGTGYASGGLQMNHPQAHDTPMVLIPTERT
jgi:5-formyltetrahydrofolate cyclo-ligase